MDLKILLYSLAFSLNLRFIVSDPFKSCRLSPKFSTKTGYNMLLTPKYVNKPVGYTAIQINMVARHGERYPGNNDMKDMMKFSEKINKFKKTLSKKVNLTLPWFTPFAGDEDKMLAEAGESTLFLLGERISKSFPELFVKRYNPHNYHFISTCKTRTTGSAASLGLGIFTGRGHLGKNKLQPIHLKVNPCDKDIILKAQDNCARYKKEVKQKGEFIEVSKFKKGPEVQEVIDAIKVQFGQPSMQLSYNEIKLMYDICAWEISMYKGKLSKGMCSMFTPYELSVIEYVEDMDDYYKRSTGQKISYESSCTLLKDILNSLRASVKQSSNPIVPSGIFRFGHSDTILPFHALLGVYTNKKHMLASNFFENRERVFRGGCISPFSANFYFILYREDNGSNHKILFYVNERLTKIPGCDSSINCDFSTFEKQYQDIVDKCDYNKICSISLDFDDDPVK